jgi:hypothetical protein
MSVLSKYDILFVNILDTLFMIKENRMCFQGSPFFKIQLTKLRNSDWTKAMMEFCHEDGIALRSPWF